MAPADEGKPADSTCLLIRHLISDALVALHVCWCDQARDGQGSGCPISGTHACGPPAQHRACNFHSRNWLGQCAVAAEAAAGGALIGSRWFENWRVRFAPWML